MLVSNGRLAFQVNQALLHWIGGLERGEVHVEQIPRRHECDHFGVEIDDVKIGAVSRILANAGNSRSGRFPLNVGLLQALKGDRRRIHVADIGEPPFEVWLLREGKSRS